MIFLSIFSYVFIRPYPPFCGHTLLPKINFLTNLNLHSMTSLYISNYLTVEGKHIKKKSINVHYFLITFPLKRRCPRFEQTWNIVAKGSFKTNIFCKIHCPNLKKVIRRVIDDNNHNDRHLTYFDQENSLEPFTQVS